MEPTGNLPKKETTHMVRLMDGNTLVQMRNILIERRARVERGFGRERLDPNVVEPGGQTEIIDMAQTLEQLDRDSSLHEQERREILAIDRALGKLAVGAFGICEECDEEIPVKRLMVVPEARFCARCQTVEERQQSRSRGTPAAVAR